MHAGHQPNRTLTLDMLRHGEPEGGVMYRGSKDDPLSELGWEQMRTTLQKAQTLGYEWDKVICSPLQRCQAFAREAADKLNLDIEVNTGLRELSFGDLEGMKPADAWNQYPELLKNMWNDPASHNPPNGEAFTDFTDRVKASLESLIAQGNERLLCVVHGGVVRATLYNLINMGASATFRVDIPYASLTRFQIYLNDDASYEASLAFLNGIR